MFSQVCVFTRGGGIPSPMSLEVGRGATHFNILSSIYGGVEAVSYKS